MSFVVKKLRLAEQDALDAAIWYEKRQTGLGRIFWTKEIALSECSAARRCIIGCAEVRRMPIHRFKFYGIYYMVRGEEVWVLAIFHGRRHTRSLQQRVRQSSVAKADTLNPNPGTLKPLIA